MRSDNNPSRAKWEEKEGRLKGTHFDIIRPSANFRGKSYNDLIAHWWNWLLSIDPDRYYDPLIVPLRGHMQYETVNDPATDVSKAKLTTSTLSAFDNFDIINDRTGLKCLTISSNSSLFLGVYVSNFVVGDRFKGKELVDIFDCLESARQNFQENSALFANYSVLDESQESTIKKHEICPDKYINEFYLESTGFDLSVSEDSKFKDKLEEGYNLAPDKYRGVGVGIYLLVTDIKPGKYRFDFGGSNYSGYITRAIYDITVEDKPHTTKFNNKTPTMVALNYSFIPQ